MNNITLRPAKNTNEIIMFNGEDEICRIPCNLTSDDDGSPLPAEMSMKYRSMLLRLLDGAKVQVSYSPAE